MGQTPGAPPLPFQNWCKIKEAFAPELVARAFKESTISVDRCIDPFGGSGTTGLVSQFLGAHPVLAEVNPYLADLIEAKLTPYPSAEQLNRDLDTVLDASACVSSSDTPGRYSSAPRTLVEPGHDGRWIFSRQVAERIGALLEAIEDLDAVSSRLFRVLLGGILVKVSNVRISGKGRRYRKGWENRVVPPEGVSEMFSAAARRVIEDISRFGVSVCHVLRGDTRGQPYNTTQCQPMRAGRVLTSIRQFV